MGEKTKNEDIGLICRLNENWHPENIKIKKAGGQTNRNWIIQVGNEKYFVRLPWEAAGIVDRKIEAANILALTNSKKLAKILPKHYFYIFGKKNILSRSSKAFDLPDGTMVMEYIEGRDINGKDLEKPKIQEALIGTLCLFHTSGIKFINSYNVFRDEILKYKNKAKKYPIEKLIENREVKEIEKIEKTAKRKLFLKNGISTHNDLIFENLRLGNNEKVYLLDFEYAGFNVRDGLYYDLGIILGGNLFQKNPLKMKIFEEILEKAKKIYKKDLDNPKIYYGALANISVMFWWGIIKYFNSTEKKDKKYFKNYVLKRAQKIQFLYGIVKKNNS